MYTEDDDKVVVNKDKDNDYSNFYTSFIKSERAKNRRNASKTKKEPPKEKKKEPEVKKEETKEEDYSNYYSTFMENDSEKIETNHIKFEEDYPEVYNYDENHSKKDIVKIVILSILLIGVIVLLIFLVSKIGIFGNRADIVLTNESFIELFRTI